MPDALIRAGIRRNLEHRLALEAGRPEADRAAAVQTAPKAPETARATDTDLLLLDSEISQPQIRSLSAIDTLTPQVNVARASDERR